ncbi:MAG: PAS domain S-box protein [Desulfobacterales bacterium]
MMADSARSIEALAAEIHQLRLRIEEYKLMEKERAAAQQALRESEERYRSVFENTGTATIIIENDMTISMVNAKFEELTGYSKKRSITK